jgi:hypothetical protein
VAAIYHNIHHRGTETLRKKRAKARLELTEMAEATEECLLLEIRVDVLHWAANVNQNQNIRRI